MCTLATWRNLSILLCKCWKKKMCIVGYILFLCITSLQRAQKHEEPSLVHMNGGAQLALMRKCRHSNVTIAGTTQNILYIQFVKKFLFLFCTRSYELLVLFTTDRCFWLLHDEKYNGKTMSEFKGLHVAWLTNL